MFLRRALIQNRFMIHKRFVYDDHRAAVVVMIAMMGFVGSATVTNPQCEQEEPLRLQKRTTLLQARSTTLEQIRTNQEDVLKRWERDEEEHWRELPARSWPAVQPNPEESQGIQRLYDAAQCGPNNNALQCREWEFQMATTLVFYSVDPEEGLERFRQLANGGHVDSIVACGIILVEGLGVPANEREGIRFLKQALERGSSQAAYELATIYYIGLDNVIEEDETRAFRLFENAAAHNHTAAMYMMAECLLNGEGTERDVLRAIPIFYKAAEQGHRFARQRIRELLASKQLY